MIADQYEFILIERNIYFSYEKLLFVKNKYKCKLIMFCHDSIKIKSNIKNNLRSIRVLFESLYSPVDKQFGD